MLFIAFGEVHAVDMTDTFQVGQWPRVNCVIR